MSAPPSSKMAIDGAYLLPIACIFVLYFICRRLFTRRDNCRLPPGPRPLPLIGNLLDLPKGHEGIFWTKHAESYGPMSCLTVLGSTIVILNDMQLAIDLLEKKRTIFSNRPAPEFLVNLCEVGDSLVFQQYGDRFRAMRKLFHQFIGTRASVSRYEPLVEIEVRRLLLKIKRDPKQFRSHIRRLEGTIILKMTYGYDVRPDGADPMIDLAESNLQRFSLSSQPGSWLVDVFPAISYLPDWFPGTGYRKTAKEWKTVFEEGRMKPFDFTKRRMAVGDYPPSFVSDNLKHKDVDVEYERLIRWAAQDMYGGGADTTVSVLSTFFLAMVLHPEVVRRAQEELDHIVGEGRLPIFADRLNLPYVESVMKECLRWNVVTPSGVPHVAAQDDVHNGHLIPKGSVIIPNIWKFTHDPNIYQDPFSFKPERYLASKGRSPELDPRNLIFGFGRRICPGREFADSSLFITMAMCLAVFDFEKVKDSDGCIIEPVVAYSTGTISHPGDFLCSITPRNEKAATLIETILIEHPFGPGDADKLDGIYS